MITITTVRQNVTYLTLTFDVYGPYYAISKIPSEQTDEDKRRFPHEIEQFESDKKEWDNKYSCGEGINCISGNEYNFEFSDYDMFRRGLLTSCIIRHYLCTTNPGPGAIQVSILRNLYCLTLRVH